MKASVGRNIKPWTVKTPVKSSALIPTNEGLVLRGPISYIFMAVDSRSGWPRVEVRSLGYRHSMILLWCLSGFTSWHLRTQYVSVNIPSQPLAASQGNLSWLDRGVGGCVFVCVLRGGVGTVKGSWESHFLFRFVRINIAIFTRLVVWWINICDILVTGDRLLYRSISRFINK